MHPLLESFIANCESVICDFKKAPVRVKAIAPLMQKLAADADKFLSAEHFRSDPEHY